MAAVIAIWTDRFETDPVPAASEQLTEVRSAPAGGVNVTAYWPGATLATGDCRTLVVGVATSVEESPAIVDAKV